MAKDYITSLSNSSDGRWLASSSFDHNVWIIDARSGEWECTLRGHGGRIWVADFSPTGQYLVSGGRDSLLRLWRYDVLE
jgi:WD40 repeat protein